MGTFSEVEPNRYKVDWSIEPGLLAGDTLRWVSEGVKVRQMLASSCVLLCRNFARARTVDDLLRVLNREGLPPTLWGMSTDGIGSSGSADADAMLHFATQVRLVLAAHDGMARPFGEAIQLLESCLPEGWFLSSSKPSGSEHSELIDVELFIWLSRFTKTRPDPRRNGTGGTTIHMGAPPKPTDLKNRIAKGIDSTLTLIMKSRNIPVYFGGVRHELLVDFSTFDGAVLSGLVRNVAPSLLAMKFTKECHCGHLFEPNAKFKAYCSTECQKNRTKIADKNRPKRDRRAEKREYRAAKRAESPNPS
jgi:hypothetical protein